MISSGTGVQVGSGVGEGVRVGVGVGVAVGTGVGVRVATGVAVGIPDWAAQAATSKAGRMNTHGRVMRDLHTGFRRPGLLPAWRCG
jgi:hypothetical protein